MINGLFTTDGLKDVLPSPKQCELFLAGAVMVSFEHHGEGILIKEDAARKLVRAMAARALENDE